MSVVFTVTAARADGFNINFTNFAGNGAEVFLELNRAKNFASDDTLQLRFTDTIAGSQNTFEVKGLPNDTPFYMRMFNPSAGGAYSDVQYRATLPLASDASFSGYSIEPSMIVVPVDYSIAAVSFNASSSFITGYPVTNLINDDPQSSFQARSTNGSLIIALRFATSGEAIDTFAILGTMAASNAEMAVISYTDETYGQIAYQTSYAAFRCSPTVGRRASYHSLLRLPNPRTERFWAIGIRGSMHHFLARNLVVGLARQSTNASKGHGESAADLGTAGRNRFGVIDGVPGWRGRTVDLELSYLREAEYHAKYADLPALVGTTKPVLALVNPKRNLFLQDRIAFGPITSFRAETPASRRNTVSIEVNSLY